MLVGTEKLVPSWIFSKYK